MPRSRFLPVKKTSDLLLLMSNLYAVENGEHLNNTLKAGILDLPVPVLAFFISEIF